MEKKLIIFCDFDGTITESDNIVQIMKQFAPSESREIIRQILDQQITIRNGVSRLFRLIPSDQKQQIIDFVVQNATLRKGFSEFVQFCKENEIDLLITTGGIDFFVYPILDAYISREQIYCNHSSFDSEKIEILWPHPCDVDCDNDCGLCKSTILRKYSKEEYHHLVIGDSVTDLAAAKIADFTIARQYLLEKCQQLSIPYSAFQDFNDIIKILRNKVYISSRYQKEAIL